MERELSSLEFESPSKNILDTSNFDVFMAFIEKNNLYFCNVHCFPPIFKIFLHFHIIFLKFFTIFLKFFNFLKFFIIFFKVELKFLVVGEILRSPFSTKLFNSWQLECIINSTMKILALRTFYKSFSSEISRLYKTSTELNQRLGETKRRFLN